MRGRGDLARPAELGGDDILMATAYPHFDSWLLDTVSGSLARTGLAQRRKENIIGENTARLVKL